MKSMLRKSFDKLSNLINKGDQRSVLLKKNVAVSMVVKGLGLGIGYIRFPLILAYLGTMWHGVWLTVGTFTGWLSFFNIGLGNGLRNKLAESIAKNDLVAAKKYVSSTYFVISLIALGLFLVLLPILFIVDWNAVFNIEGNDNQTLRLSLIAFVVFFCMRFVLSLIRTIMEALQRPAFSDLLNFLSSSIFFLIILLLYHFGTSSLIYVISISGGVPVIILFVFTIYYFKGKYSYLRPSYKDVDVKLLKGLSSLGARFFVVQIAVIVLFATDNMIITRVFGPEDVVPYSAARKFFGIVEMGFSIVLVPFWSAFTDAFVKGDISWVKKSIHKLTKVLGLVTLALIVMLLISPFVFKVWLKDMVEIPWHLSLCMAIYVLVRCWNNIFVFFINGVGKITIQLYMSIFTSIINIPLSIFLAKTLNMGVQGVIMATIFCLLIGSVLHPIQYYKIIKGTARGLWDK